MKAKTNTNLRSANKNRALPTAAAPTHRAYETRKGFFAGTTLILTPDKATVIGAVIHRKTACPEEVAGQVWFNAYKWESKDGTLKGLGANKDAAIDRLLDAVALAAK